MHMKRAISVTVDEDNLVWLKAQATASGRNSVSEVLDRLVSDARAQGRTDQAAIRSIAGTIDLPEVDEDFAKADAYVRAAFERSLRRPMLVKERPPAARPKRR